MEGGGFYTGMLNSNDPTDGFDDLNFSLAQNTPLIDLNYSFTQETSVFSGNVVSSQPQDDVVELAAAKVNAGSGRRAKKGVSHRQKKFDIEEDKVICSAWLQISKDPIVGANQPRGTFWGRIHAFFEENKNKKTSTIDRTETSIMHRWGFIQKEVNKFCSCYEKIERRNASGTTIQDTINAALETFEREDEENKQQKFTLMHCYNILKDEDKWKTLRLELNQKNKKQKTTKESTPSNNPLINIDEVQEAATPDSNERKRPPGQKQVKQARRDDASLAALEKMWEKKEARDEKRDKAKEAALAVEKAALEVERGALELEKASIELEKKRLAIDDKKNEAALLKEEKDIMFADKSSLDEDELKWLQIMKKKILARHMGN